WMMGVLPMAMAMGLRLPRTEWPAFVLASPDPRAAPIIAVAKHDTARMRAAIRALDSAAAGITGATVVGQAAIAADIALIVGDSTGALRRARVMLDSLMPPVSFSEALGSIGMLWPRMMLLRADLASALGFPEEARAWYKRFIDLWSGADPEFQPLVQRA